MRICIHTTGSHNAPVRRYSAVDAAIQLSPTKSPCPRQKRAGHRLRHHRRSRDHEVSDDDAGDGGDNGRLAGAVTQRHEESDAGACAEQNRLSFLADNRQTSSLVAGTGAM